MAEHPHYRSLLPIPLVLSFVLTTAYLVGAASAATATPRCRGERATIVGTPRADTLKGTAGPDVIVGLDGRDEIDALAGDDLVCGGGRPDDIDPGPGDDIVYGGRANDVVWPGPGEDEIFGGRGGDYLYAGAGDSVFAGAGSRTDVIRDEAGNALIDGGPGTGDLLIVADAPAGVTVDLAAGTATGNGTDTLSGIESVWGSPFDDVITGNGQPNQIWGLDGNDVLSSGGGGTLACPDRHLSWATYEPMRCADVLWGAQGDDTLTGGVGFDAVLYYHAVTADLPGGAAIDEEGTDTLTSIEGVQGSEHDDVLIGDDADNVFLLFFGNDVVEGGGGIDLIGFYGGATTVDLGAGTATSAPHPFLALSGTFTLSGVEDVIGTRFADTITGDGEPNRLFGLESADTISGAGGNDTLDGGVGNDNLDGGAGIDVCVRGETVIDCEL